MAEQKPIQKILWDHVDKKIAENPDLYGSIFDRGREVEREETQAKAKAQKWKNQKTLICLMLAFLAFCLPQLWLGEYPQLKTSFGIISLMIIPFVTAFFSKAVDSNYSGALALVLFGVVLYSNGILTNKDLWEIFMKKTTEK